MYTKLKTFIGRGEWEQGNYILQNCGLVIAKVLSFRVQQTFMRFMPK